jgi:hypothetical protein
VLESALKNDDLPTLGKPTIPILRLLEGRPSRAFFSATGAFLGGIFGLFLDVGGEVEKVRDGRVGFGKVGRE